MAPQAQQVTWVEVAIVSGIIVALIAVATWFFKQWHKDGDERFKALLGRIDKLIDKVGELAKAQAVHNERLENGQKEFQKISDHQKDQDKRLRDLENNVIQIKTSLDLDSS